MDKTGLMLVLIVFQVADLVTTYMILERGGYEKNVFLVRLATWISKYTNAKWAWLVVAKLAAVTGCVVAVSSMSTETEYLELLLAALIAFYAWVIMNNVSELH